MESGRGGGASTKRDGGKLSFTLTKVGVQKVLVMLKGDRKCFEAVLTWNVKDIIAILKGRSKSSYTFLLRPHRSSIQYRVILQDSPHIPSKFPQTFEQIVNSTYFYLGLLIYQNEIISFKFEEIFMAFYLI